MLAIIAKLEGASGLLFHVEQRNNETVWDYRVRFPQSQHAGLREWQRERSVTGEGVYFPLVDPTVPVEAEWKEGGAEWVPAVPHEFREGVVAPFQVKLLQARDKRKDPYLRVTAMVRGGLATYIIELPPRLIAAGEVLEAEGISYGFGPGCHLREAGEFMVSSEAFVIANRGPGQAALLPVAAAVPGANPVRETPLVIAGKLNGDEIEQILAAQPESHA